MQKGSLSLLRIAMVALLCLVTLPVLAEDATAITTKTTFSATEANTGDKAVKHLVKIGNATVQIVLNGGNAFIVVKEGPLNITYADGTPMCTIPTGQGIQVNGFLGGGSGLTLDPATGSLALAPALGLNVTLGNKGAPVELTTNPGGTKVSVEPGKSTTVKPTIHAFAAGQTVNLQPGQVGTVGDTGLIAIGAENKQLVVTTNSQSASLTGAGSDTITVGKNSMLKINKGQLNVTGTGASLTGTGSDTAIEVQNGGGAIQVKRGNQTVTLLPNQRVLGNATPIDTTGSNTPPPPPVAVKATKSTTDLLKLTGFNPTGVLGTYNKDEVIGADRSVLSDSGL